MERLTSNKNVSDMSMIELAHNCCYVDNKCNARYRDYNLDIDSRELVRNLVKDVCDEDLTDLSDEEFDEYMSSMLEAGMDSTIGLLEVFYRNLWAMAELREKLKDYEDLEEQGRLVKLPCKVGDTVYCIENKEIYTCIVEKTSISRNNGAWVEISFPKEMQDIVAIEYNSNDIGETVFLTKSEAEAKLKELRGGENDG